VVDLMRERNKDNKTISLPFEERAGIFQKFVQLESINLAEDEKYDLRDLGGKIIEFHFIKSEDDKRAAKEEIHHIYDHMKNSDNKMVRDAVMNVTLAEIGIL
jgi:hypothetical protein